MTPYHKTSARMALRYTTDTFDPAVAGHGLLLSASSAPTVDGQETWRRRLLEGSGSVPEGPSNDQPARRAIATAASCELTPNF